MTEFYVLADNVLIQEIEETYGWPDGVRIISRIDFGNALPKRILKVKCPTVGSTLQGKFCTLTIGMDEKTCECCGTLVKKYVITAVYRQDHESVYRKFI